MNALSPARRVRRTFMRLGQSIAVIAFLAIAGDVLFEQWIAGYASAFFIFGTACLIAAACTALFAIIAGIGLVASSAFSDEPPGMGPQQREP
jgi:predicted neutral ceramidase superfamily lipid hydrolase